MSDTPLNPKPFRLAEGDGLGFADDGVRVPVIWPQFGESDLSEDISQDALQWLQNGLLVALEGGRADGIASRTAALAVIAGLFDSAASAADRLGMDRKAISRGIESILAELNAQTKTQNNIENTSDLSPL